MARRDRAEERQVAVEDHVETTAQHNAGAGQPRTGVGCRDGECAGRSRRPRNRTERGARAAVVPCRSDDQRVQVDGALYGLGLGAVGERSVRLGDPDQGDPDRVVCISVTVGIDSAVEAGDQLG